MMAEDLDSLLEDALQHLPPPKAKKTETLGPAYPRHTQHHSPLEAESRFVRYCCWWDEVECNRCQHIAHTFDGLYEEREWLRPEEHPAEAGTKHWLGCSVAPLPELMKDAVAYVRYYRNDFCEECLGATKWPLAQSFKGGEIVAS